eukprot:NODE_744_length_1937_cov_23.815148_g689_i0.p1 GENE.NODE_744_length_1937_cov_23.815148_g689_i0~~NODE_744_length_1937_cov_23.815148_g689_i0.p1  ORF type:complete len:568 (-),score=82.53 NODE_744_length_1937_cov_23.815148_g689_i0:154-1857(-)
MAMVSSSSCCLLPLLLLLLLSSKMSPSYGFHQASVPSDLGAFSNFIGQPVHHEEKLKPSQLRGAFRGFCQSMKAWILGADADESPLMRLLNQPDSEERRDDAHMAEYPYWRFMPRMEPTVRLGGPPVVWSNWCFGKNSLTFLSRNDTHVHLKFTHADKRDVLCTDTYGLLATSVFELYSPELPRTEYVSVSLPNHASAADLYDIDNAGIRVAAFQISPKNIIRSINSTVDLFLGPLTHKGVPPNIAAANSDFVMKYARMNMTRLLKPLVPPKASQIRTGDLFAGIRLDGLDPMLAWAMGATTGHVTSAIWINGELFVTESTAKDSYWPTDGIQRTPYATWIKQVQDANYNVMWLPLKDEYAQKYDVAKAEATLARFLGLPYGYHNMIFAWIDTPEDNYPCLPPEFDTCLDWRTIEPLFGFADMISKRALGDLLWNGAMNLRLGTSGLGTAELYQKMAQRGVTFRNITVLEEQDDWEYNTGYSRMCDAWVCTLWKSSGVMGDMGDKLQCTEFTNWDVTSLPFFKSKQQIAGNYQFDIPNMNSKPWAPYPHYATHCGGHAPNFVRSRYC